MSTNLARLFADVRLLHVHWELRSKADGRMLRCGVYETEQGRALLAGYDEAWLWRASLGETESGTATAHRWLRAMQATGTFEEVDSPR